MNQNDQQLIANLSNRLKQAQPARKDPEAEYMITQEIAPQPDAVYLLTQAVLLQEQAIRSLQQQLNELQATQKRGFFSSLFGGKNQSHLSSLYQNASSQDAPKTAFGGNSFLGSALNTAVGVAGGIFLFEGLSHLFRGSHSTISPDSMLSNSMMADPLQGQSAMLDDGFGTGDNFMNDATSNMGSDGFDGDWGDSF